ncbi:MULTISPECIES: hypothetical protein [Thermomonospora]|uniref:Uncharacterized protein n=1 Tax=Thermomonospora curvata (strain ATCC 19995 / DSM 43183 / JCM 3096 / KCTC 9072 / NBRC 15933 / NCIMB 10081 / Henssen B9) TaxID=471852 RepID=D1AD39_THECD|nr:MULTISPECIES: hypothetical protein [Thermomonospora]ACY99348.1 hypothetical protein Tcur_3817 [Thermomonospora curvata DSM 43183]PKK12399.1 MAG: transcriptional regulator [Thermomonospora sp. CIF 1]
MPTAEESRWRTERERLNRRRAELGEEAARLYRGAHRVGSTSLLCRPEWIPDVPLPLERVELVWEETPEPPVVTGAQAPLPPGYRAYSQAMGALAAPAVFENRPVYRLLEADLAGRGGSGAVLRLSGARYFDGVDVGEAVAHELAARVAGLPLRTLVGDPCDLARRTAVPAVTTVTIRRRARDVVLHRRDPAKVAHAGGLYQVMPVGVFQPVTEDPREDLDLWRCMAREFAEEFLGADEEYRPGFSYREWPFYRRLEQARAAGAVRVHCLGIGVDPLSLAVDVLTAAVIDDAAFGELFGGLVRVNAEGRVAMAPLEGPAPRPMQPAGAAALELARRHRDLLLSRR